MTESIDAVLFKKMIVCAANKLNENKGYVDSLNVFPVPDGDTGTNMALTFTSAAREISEHEYNAASDVATSVAKATLRGARGNSGVILSQIFRGISRTLSGSVAFSTEDFARAMQKGSDTAYRAVMKPTEGTILTVIRLMAKAASEFEGEDFESLFAHVNSEGKLALDNTPELLPQLKQAGVVDAGGRGLLFIFEGMEAALTAGEVTLSDTTGVSKAHGTESSDEKAEETSFTYSADFVLEKYNDSMSAGCMRRTISPIGDNLELAEEGSVIKGHINTNNPGFVLEQAVRLGELTDVKIVNLKRQPEKEAPKEALDEAPLTERELAVIAVAAGDGICAVFKELGAAYVISGGQTMNPSTEDVLAAIEKVNAENVIILPNNKNIILSAEQAKKLAEVNVAVIPSKTIPQGITAMMNFLPEGSLSDNASAMEGALSEVKSGSVTHAVRDSSFEGIEIHRGDYLGMREGAISLVGQNLNTTLLNLIDSMTDDNSEIITVYCGADVTDDDAAALSKTLEEKYSDCDVCVRRGNQPVYFYFVSVE